MLIRVHNSPGFCTSTASSGRLSLRIGTESGLTEVMCTSRAWNASSAVLFSSMMRMCMRTCSMPGLGPVQDGFGSSSKYCLGTHFETT